MAEPPVPRRRPIINMSTSTGPPSSGDALTATYRPPPEPVLQYRLYPRRQPITAMGFPAGREVIGYAYVEGDGEVDGVSVDGEGVVIGRLVDEDQNGNAEDGGVAGGGGRVSRLMIGVGLVITLLALSFSRARADDDVGILNEFNHLANSDTDRSCGLFWGVNQASSSSGAEKLVLLGDCGLGECCFVRGLFDPVSFDPIRDTAGQDRYAALAPLCNAVLVYDVTCPDFSTEPHDWVKVLLWGDCGVGKSCIVLQFVCGQIDPTSNVTAAASFTKYQKRGYCQPREMNA